MTRIAHISDVHFGKIAHDEIVDLLVEEINAADVDLVAVSGDLTQRAFPSQYRAARAMLDSFKAPVIVVPGNHDVYAWWRPVTRVSDPVGRYRKYITDDLTPRLELPGVAAFGLNSAFGLTVKGGMVRDADRAEMARWMAERAEGTFRVLVIHHHLTKIGALGPHDVARNAEETLDAAADAGVDLILCGHLHISHIEPIDILPGKHRMVIASAGTATSSRGRRKHRGINFYNMITVEPERFMIEERSAVAGNGGFTTACVTTFGR